LKSNLMLSKLARANRGLPVYRQFRKIHFNSRALGLFNQRFTSAITIQTRNFAKSRKTAAKKDKYHGAEYSLDAMTSAQDEHLDHMKEVFESLKAENTDAQSLLSDVKVEIDGSPMPIKALGSVTKKSAQIISIGLYDESYLNATVSAIEAYESSFSPTLQDETTIYCAIPKMTKEFKQKLIQVAKDTSGKTKVGIRREEKDEQHKLSAYSDAIEKSDFHKIKKEVENQTNQRLKQVEDMTKAKIKELETKK